MTSDRPAYRVPSMGEIDALPWNGLNVISTFSGCGGSSLGYRLAGFRVLLASEFVPAAQDTYRLNASPSTLIDGRDIRTVTGAELLAQVGLGVGELDVFDGSPPCASFSTAGAGAKGWGKVKSYSDTKQRTDDLFYEYSRLLADMQPRAFIAENVAGLVKGAAKGYFKRIHAELSAAGYRVGAAVLDAAWLGVPQSRRRTIFVGFRSDLGIDPVFPSPLPYRYSMADALPHLAGQIEPGRSLGDKWSDVGPGFRDAGLQPSATIGASPQTGNGRFPPSVVALAIRDMSKSAATLRSLDLASPTVTANGMGGTSSSEAVWAGMVAKRMAPDADGYSHAFPADRPAPTVMAHGVAGVGSHQLAVGPQGAPVFVREDDGQMLDPETGFDLGRVSPMLVAAYPDRMLRRMSLIEVRRLCSFPDDFQLSGSYGQRWERMGRAVPPVMMSHIASTVRDALCAG